jgi:leucyl aminopeptidase
MKLTINIIHKKMEKDINIVNNNITLYIYKPTNYEILLLTTKLANHFKIYDIIDMITVIFDKMDSNLIDRLLIKLDNIFYSFYPNNTKINYTNINSYQQKLISRLKNYKDIVMETHKTPDTYLKHIKDNIPKDYKVKIYKIKPNDKTFSLVSAVGQGSRYNSYFIHIYKKNQNKHAKNIVLIGKSITYDAGGLDLKLNHMNLMKTDMTGSAIILNVLLLLHDNHDNHNIHLLIPIAENMISNMAVRPGTVIDTMCGTSVEITNTDAEGRLCLADALSYCIKYLMPKIKINLILSIATMTGNVCKVSSVGSVLMSNTIGYKYARKIKKIGEDIGEYCDYIKLRDEYKPFLLSTVADISNYNPQCTAGTAYAGMFLKHFINDEAPWIYIDIGCGTFDDNKINSYGILLLYKFIKKI